MQTQVAEEVATALRLKLAADASRVRTASRLVDPRAYELYLRGRQASAERNLRRARSNCMNRRLPSMRGWPKRSPACQKRCTLNPLRRAGG